MATQDDDVTTISDRYVQDFARLSPIVATLYGITGYDDQIDDFSPEGHQARRDLAADALAAMRATRPTEPAAVNAREVFLERVGLEVEVHDAGARKAALNVIEGPVQDVRAAFDLMPTETAQDWSVIAARLAKVPDGLAGHRVSLLESAKQGVVSARRQVAKVAEQCRIWAGGTGTPAFFTTFVEGAVDGAPRGDLEETAAAASAAYAEFAEFLTGELLPLAPEQDAVGEERYRLHSREFIGAALDLREAYEWGFHRFTEVETEMRQVAARIGGTPAEAAALLDQQPRYQVHGRAEFEAWMQQLSDRALADLRGVYFDIPDPLMRLDCRIAPPGGSLGAYYTGPSQDFSRPGTMWWSVQADKQDFVTWHETSTVYHEGVPGHHLQIATAAYQDSLNAFQRRLASVPAYCEGWALYAERLMRDFGYLDDDGDLLGLLDAQLFRAARVIVDIGMHLQLPIPADFDFHPNERWNAALGVEFMSTRTVTDHETVVDEIDRYLGWPGQAATYSLGERFWLGAREDVRRRHGADFDLKQFHMRALEMGPMGLDTLGNRLTEL